MSTLLWSVGAIAVCVGLLYLAHRLEPHWVSKDGTRFLTTCEPIDRWGSVTGRRREVRGAIMPDGGLTLAQRSIVRSTSSVWRVRAKSPHPPRSREIYLLSAIPPAGDGSLLALRVPAGSKLVGILDDLAPEVAPGEPRAFNAPPPDRGTWRWGRRADPR